MRNNFGENRNFSGTGYLIIHTKEPPIRASLSWCRRRDLNPHGLRHTPLKRACLPFHHFGTRQELAPRNCVLASLNPQRTQSYASGFRLLRPCCRDF